MGDGRSDPALTDDKLTIEAERLDPAVRDGLARFFRTALARDPKARFDNAEEMLRAWREVFEQAERRTVTTPTGAEVPLHVGIDQADPETLVALLGLSTRATNALDRAGVTTARQLAAMPVGEVLFMRGVGKKTRDEVIAAIDRLRRRFPEAAGNGRPAKRPATTVEDPATLDLDTLRRRLIDVAARSKTAPVAIKIRSAYLGLDDEAGDTHDWPTQADVVARLGKKRQQVSQVLTSDREKWSRDRHVTALRDDLLRLIRSAGGVIGLPELADALVALRGTVREEPKARARLASALVRVAYETEQARAEPRLHLRRAGRGPLLAVTATRAPSASRPRRAGATVNLNPTQCFRFPTLLMRSRSGPLSFPTTMSMSPSLSTSPNASPRLTSGT